MTAQPPLLLHNAEAASMADIPVLDAPEFRARVMEEHQRGARLAALFGQPLDVNGLRLWALLANESDGTLAICAAHVFQ